MPLPAGVRVLAAANPYRRRAAISTASGDDEDGARGPGLVYNGGDNAASAAFDPMDGLVYRVHPLPPSLLEFAFDFGALSDDAEELYATHMVNARFSKATRAERRALTVLLVAAQRELRRAEGDASAVSLRDLRRALDLTRFFARAIAPAGSTAGSMASMSLAAPATLALAHVYCFRLARASQRASLWNALRSALNTLAGRCVTTPNSGHLLNNK